jgi:hypothetical protein
VATNVASQSARVVGHLESQSSWFEDVETVRPNWEMPLLKTDA